MKQGFISTDNELPKDSKAGNSTGATKNVLASSANISASPNSTATGEDAEFAEDKQPHNIEQIQKIGDEDIADDDEQDVYTTSSDELEMATALLEEATQAPVNPNRDPSSAVSEIQEADDDLEKVGQNLGR